MAANPLQSLIRSRALTGFTALVKRHGGDSRYLLKSADIDPALLRDPDSLLPLPALARLLELSAEDLGLDDFGMALAQYQDISVLGPVALAARSAETVRAALGSIARYLPYHTPGARLWLEDDPHCALVHTRYDLSLPPGPQRRQVVELSYAVAMKYLGLISAQPPDQLQISFRHERGASPQTYQRYFGCEVHLGGAMDAITISPEILDLPLTERDPELGRIAASFIDNITHRYPLDITRQVETLLNQQLASGQCSLPRIASQLGLHERTLQRRLADRDVYFEDILDDLRKTRAMEYLPHATIPLTQVAALLGYTEQSSFIRACRRWFGCTPTAVRMQSR